MYPRRSTHLSFGGLFKPNLALSFIMTYMKKHYFGTDGIRGEVGQFPIVPEFMTRLAYAAGKVLTKNSQSGERC